MRFVADSSLLVRLYLHDRNSEAIEGFLAEDAKVVSLSALARVEVLNVLLRQESSLFGLMCLDCRHGQSSSWSRMVIAASALSPGPQTILNW